MDLFWGIYIVFWRKTIGGRVSEKVIWTCYSRSAPPRAVLPGKLRKESERVALKRRLMSSERSIVDIGATLSKAGRDIAKGSRHRGMKDKEAFNIRKNSFLGGIMAGAVVSFALVEQSLRSLVIGGIVGGNLIGGIGESAIGGDMADTVGAGLTLGLIGGIVLALTVKPYSAYSLIIILGSGGCGLIIGLVSHFVGWIFRKRMTS